MRDETPPADEVDSDQRRKVDSDQRRQPDDLAGRLGDPAVWAKPSSDLEERVVEAVAAEVTRRRG